MDAVKANAKIYAGRGKVAARLGLDYDLYRPGGTAGDPLAVKVLTLKASFNATDNVYGKANMPGKAYWYADLDGRLTQPGDYLVHATNPQDVKFVAAMQSLLPVLMVDCNRTVRIARAAQGLGFGAQGYGGVSDSPALFVDVLGTNPAGAAFVGWPCSVLLGGRSQVGMTLPADVK
jgi:hypothetical protein